MWAWPLLVTAFILGAFSHKMYLRYKKKPEPRKLKLGDHVKVIIDKVHATGTFMGWVLQADITGLWAKVMVNQAAKEGSVWLIDPKNVTYICDEDPSTINLEETELLN